MSYVRCKRDKKLALLLSSSYTKSLVTSPNTLKEHYFDVSLLTSTEPITVQITLPYRSKCGCLMKLSTQVINRRRCCAGPTADVCRGFMPVVVRRLMGSASSVFGFSCAQIWKFSVHWFPFMTSQLVRSSSSTKISYQFGLSIGRRWWWCKPLVVWVGCTYLFKVSGGAWSVSNERSVEQHEIHHVNLVASAQLMMIDDDILRQTF